MADKGKKIGMTMESAPLAAAAEAFSGTCVWADSPSVPAAIADDAVSGMLVVAVIASAPETTAAPESVNRLGA